MTQKKQVLCDLQVLFSDIQLSNSRVDKTLPDNFCLRRGNFAELEISHKQLEYTIEILFRILNFAGYCSEKSEQTSISGTHDVSHAIYATKADFLVTMDRRFAKKCKAVYNPIFDSC